MASLPEEKETRSPTPDTLVEDPRNFDNIKDKALDSAEGSIKQGESLENANDFSREEETTVREEDEYATGIKLGFIIIALALSIFLVCHPFLTRITIIQSLTHGAGLIRYDHCGYDHPENHR
jgi:hypothetical protein